MKPITYISDQPKDYASALTKADTRAKLLSVLNEYSEIAADALEAAPQTDLEFQDFRMGLDKERRGKFAGEAWANRYAAILMPEVMFQVSVVAAQFKVPWGLAFIRCHEAGKIQVRGKTARWESPAPKGAA